MITQDHANRPPGRPDRPASIDLWPVEHLATLAETAGMSPGRLLATEDVDQAAGKLTPAARLTCPDCRTWATPAHLRGPAHTRTVRLHTALAGMHADLAAACSINHPGHGPAMVRLTAASVRDRLAALLAGGRHA